MEKEYALGKKPAQPGTIKFRFDYFFDVAKLPDPPKEFWIARDNFHGWRSFDNEDIGDCVLAGAANETMQWNNEGGHEVRFDTRGVVSDYSAVAGYVPGRPDTDNGSDMGDAARYRRKIGIIDVNGKRHKIDAYVALKKGDFEQLKYALWMFGGAGIGLRFPDYGFSQFNRAQPWDIGPFVRLKGGHYVPGFGINDRGNIMCVSWGRLQEMTPAFYRTFSDEACAYLDISRLKNNLTPEGFRYDLLKDWLDTI